MRGDLHMSVFQSFITINKLKKKNIAEYLGVSSAFITQLTQGLRGIPNEKIALIKANESWDTSMFGVDGDLGVYIENSNEDLYLHHYTTDEGLIGILKDMALNFSELKNSNDVKEKFIIRSLGKVEWGNIKQIKQDISDYKYIAFCSFDSERINRPRMWAQYGKRKKDGVWNKGACIEINITKLISNNKHLDLQMIPIKYDNRDHTGEAPLLEELKYKHTDWSGESEIRIVYIEKGENDNVKSLNIEGCISKIYLGHEFEAESKQEISEVLISEDSKCFKKIAPCHFKDVIISKNGHISYNNSLNSIFDIVRNIMDNEYATWLDEFEFTWDVLYDVPIHSSNQKEVEFTSSQVLDELVAQRKVIEAQQQSIDKILAELKKTTARMEEAAGNVGAGEA